MTELERLAARVNRILDVAERPAETALYFARCGDFYGVFTDLAHAQTIMGTDAIVSPVELNRKMEIPG